MTDPNLIRMANQIGLYFATLPDRHQGLREASVHLQRFWTPAMRQALARMDDTKEPVLSPFMQEVVRLYLAEKR